MPKIKCIKQVARRKAERPTEILAAAFEEFVLNGFSATRLEDVAARADVTKGTIYFHFQSKENVFIQMVKEMTKPIHESTREFLISDPHQGLDFLLSYLDFSYNNLVEDRCQREIFRLLVAEAPRFPTLIDEHFQSVLEPVFSRLQDCISKAVKTGEARETPACEFPDILIAPMLAMNIYMLVVADLKPIDPKRHLAAAKDLLLNGLLSRSPPGAPA